MNTQKTNGSSKVSNTGSPLRAPIASPTSKKGSVGPGMNTDTAQKASGSLKAGTFPGGPWKGKF